MALGPRFKKLRWELTVRRRVNSQRDRWELILVPWGESLGAIDPTFCNMCPFWFMNKSFFDILNLLVFLIHNTRFFMYIRMKKFQAGSVILRV